MPTDLCSLADIKAWLSLPVYDQWAKATTYQSGVKIVPTTANGYYYTSGGGTSGATEPTWPKTIGATVSENSPALVWTCAGINDDIVLAKLIKSATQTILNYISRDDIPADDYTETRSGNGSGQKRIQVVNTPINSVASVTIDGVAIPASTDFGSPGYIYDKESIVLAGYEFAKGLDNVVIAYNGGFASIPDDIAQVCVELVALRNSSRTRIGHQSKSLAGETVSFITDDLTSAMKGILNQGYRRVVPL